MSGFAKVVAVVGSAKKPESLLAFAASLPDWLPAPVVMTLLHEGPDEHLRLIDQIAHRTAMPIHLVSRGSALEAGALFIATERRALRVHVGGVECCSLPDAPFAAALMRSTVTSYGEKSLVVLLDGVLDDARAYAQKVVVAGGQIFAHHVSPDERLVRNGVARAYGAADILGEAIALVCTRRPSLRAV